jgi:tight adherence protein C
MGFELEYIAWFLAASSLVLLVFLLVGSRRQADQPDPAAMAKSAVPYTRQPERSAVSPQARNRVEELVSQRLQSEERKDQMRERMIQAGLYRPNAGAVFLAARLLLLVCMIGLGFLVSQLGFLPLMTSLLIAAFCGLVATIAPSFWLDTVKRSRQTKIRRALPDALDVISVCLQGGLSLPGSLLRVARELGTAHPMLALELAIVEREIQMGRTTGQALRRFAERFDLEELRSLSSVVSQAERFGSSLTRAMEVYAESLRLKRHQRAEQMAHKAAIKILFPTLFCIFPGIFVVILGPAGIRIYETVIKPGLLRGMGS